jgi:hypothetical protein
MPSVVQFVEALRYKPEGLVFDSRWCHYGPVVDSASNRKRYQEYVLGPVLRANTLSNVMCRMSGNLRSLNLLEPSGLAQFCAGIALPLPLHLLIVVTVCRGK